MVAELVDAIDSKSIVGNNMRVRFSPTAHIIIMATKKTKIELASSIDFQVNGGKKLHGTIKTNFSKNGSVGLLCASLLNKGVTTLHGIAHIEEVNRVIEILESIGVKVVWQDKNTVIITPPKEFKMENLNTESAIKTRSVVMLIGPLIH